MLSDKKLSKIEKDLGKDFLEGLAAGQVDELRIVISNSAGAMKHAREELEANPKYMELKESLKALSSGMGEVNKRQNAIIQYCLHLLEEKGQA